MALAFLMVVAMAFTLMMAMTRATVLMVMAMAFTLMMAMTRATVSMVMAMAVMRLPQSKSWKKESVYKK